MGVHVGTAAQLQAQNVVARGGTAFEFPGVAQNLSAHVEMALPRLRHAGQMQIGNPARELRARHRLVGRQAIGGIGRGTGKGLADAIKHGGHRPGGLAEVAGGAIIGTNGYDWGTP